MQEENLKIERKKDLDEIVSWAKRRGFVYPAAEIYGGLNGVHDYGPMGVLLRQNIKNAWLANIRSFEEEVVMMDGSILGQEDVWVASGHVKNFSDPLVDCNDCKKRFRSDEYDLTNGCPFCGKKSLTEPRNFHLMFQTKVGAMDDSKAIAYLRPETAQSIFINFKNVISSTRIKPPFGIAQIGKAFRNEITPKQFLFRAREFEQMEMEFFCAPEDSDRFFEVWTERRHKFFLGLGLNPSNLRLRPHASDELAHYSKACIDFEYNFPFGFKELEGLAHRGDYDLSAHTKHSGKDLVWTDQGVRFVPHVVESSVGVGRLMLALMCDHYDVDIQDGEQRVVFRIAPRLAPVLCAVLPLVNKLEEPARKLFADLKAAGFEAVYDQSGSIGKRYRRQDEVGTPVCLTVDFQTEELGSVTVRDRDTATQERVSIDKIEDFLKRVLKENRVF